MSLLIGLVGKPSAGKSTFFKAATLMDVATANYPFTTIKPNRGAGFVRVKCVHEELGKEGCNPREGTCEEGTRFLPVELLDVAGLVPGASQGKGMGNQFLDDLRQANALIHVVDFSGSTNSEGESVATGSHDPLLDIKFLETELDLWYLNIIKRAWEGLKKTSTRDVIPELLTKQLSALRVTDQMGKNATYPQTHPREWTEEELLGLATYFRKLTKPMIIAANKTDTKTGQLNFERIVKERSDLMIIATSSESEFVLRKASSAGLINYVAGSKSFEVVKELSEQQRNALNFVKDNVLIKFGSTGVQDCLDEVVFNVMKYFAVFPGSSKGLTDKQGRVLPDCFLMPPNTTTLDFAFSLHTDFGNKFIKAIDVRTNRLLGKEHVLNHRDVIEIVSGK